MKFEVIIIKFIKIASNNMDKLFIDVKPFYYNFENFGITLIFNRNTNLHKFYIHRYMGFLE